MIHNKYKQNKFIGIILGGVKLISEKLMMEYVLGLLKKYDLGSRSDNKKKIQYSRINHTKRVCKYAKDIYENYSQKEQVDYDVLITAAIFHDTGYSDQSSGISPHAIISEQICREYLTQTNYDIEFINKVCMLIREHSDKEKLLSEKSSMELVILMEADLFDDTGALGITLDIWIEALNKNVTLPSILQHIQEHTYLDMVENPMRTPYSVELWNEKAMLSKKFVEQLEQDIEEYNFIK